MLYPTRYEYDRMRSANRSTDTADDSIAPPSGRRSDRWFVTNGVVAVGPVSFEMLTKGATGGRIPTGSFVRHESWQVWRRLDEIDSLPADGREKTLEELASHSESLESRASSPHDSAPPPPPHDLVLTLRPSAPAPAHYSTIRAVDPGNVLSNAFDLGEALLLTVSTVVSAAGAEVGLVHRARHDLRSVVTVGGHGPGTERLLGERIATDDPTLTAARNGHTVISEPGLGTESRYVVGRIIRCLPDVSGVVMVPLCLYGELVALFEVGRGGQPFRAREAARAEEVVEVLAERAVSMGWLE